MDLSGRPPCNVCALTDRQSIDKACLAPHASMRAIARRIGVSQSSLWRHFKNHVREKVKEAAAARVKAEGDDLLVELENFYRVTKAILARTFRESDYKTALAAIREGVEQVRLRAELTGQLQPAAASSGYVILFDSGVPVAKAIETTALPAALPATIEGEVDGSDGENEPAEAVDETA
jgi:AcrR family transcriptional regulator